MVKYPLTLYRWHTQEQRLKLVVAKKLVSKKAEQVLRSRARGPVASLPHPAHLGPLRAPSILAHLKHPPTSVHLRQSQIHGTTPDIGPASIHT